MSRHIDIDEAIEHLRSNYNNGEGYEGSFAEELDILSMRLDDLDGGKR